jgi:MFS superfamily sulfate permease-like transporter
MVLLAALVGGAVIVWLAWRRDFVAAIVTGVALAMLLGVWAWTRGDGEDEGDESQPRE